MQERALEERHKMRPEQRQRLVNVISFDGGGIRGLILLQVSFQVVLFADFMLYWFVLC